MTTISTCEVCRGTDLYPVLDLGSQPLCDDLIPIGNSAQPTPYPIELLLCEKCLTVHQKYQVERTVLFPQTYHYRAAMTEYYRRHARIGEIGRANSRRPEWRSRTQHGIASNDGSLLNIFRKAGAQTIGIEPTGAAEDAQPRVDHVINRFFDADSVQYAPVSAARRHHIYKRIRAHQRLGRGNR